ncbi:MAG: alanine--tRNA ligase [Deltaproteobacteria bacterium]|nr:alanine--tRNA ligase [Deltaproteobacteria bacterium]MBW2025689.1 alanine--tRNA ligase [Deltaproteobacteria bacterium]MBW2125570.1 alanine--tRNA ligase [Deltaproteobacteria bacterium]
MNFREIRQAFIDFFVERGHELVPSSSLIPHDDPSLLFTNAGMVQFKRLYLGEEKRAYTRAVTSQKCMRAGGKHNDLENVGYTARHHTFFEMLGNFSFGDYFKRETIAWAWELLTEGFGLPKDKLYVSVYKDDDEAYDIWNKEIGIPHERIVRLGEKDNFWAMGDTGPCGPCSEILIDQGEELSCGRPDCAPGCDCDRYLEIWNLVFTQFDRQPDGSLVPLPSPNIDTGMGLERIAAVVQGVHSNYDTDLFQDIIGEVERLSNKKYGNDNRQDVAFRVIADHSRAAAFLIGDGVLPSNEGRGYVLRRIIRRALRFGQNLGLEPPFLHQVCSRVIQVMGQDYDELVQSKEFIEGLVKNEENRFADTLRYGMRVLNEEIEKVKERREALIPGAVAFKLYDTYGLSIDIVQDVARDEDLTVDIKGYEEAMAQRRQMSQASWRGSGEEDIPQVYKKLLSHGLKSGFLGYERLEATSKVVSIVSGDKELKAAQQGEEIEVVLDQTPFYGESGGQVGDKGIISSDGVVLQVQDTVKVGQNLIVHRGLLEKGKLNVGDKVVAKVDEERRQATALNHSATHLLHAALREILGEHVKQAGSLVSPDRLRFDFTHFTQVGLDTLQEVERWVNKRIRENLPITVTEMEREEAMKTGAMAIFEERYGERVRLVCMGDGVSKELCGGTHTARTGDIGLFRIINEGSVGANLRRIEALTGEGALRHDQAQDQQLKVMAELLKVGPDRVQDRVKGMLQDLRQKEKEIESLKAKLLTKKSEDILSEVQEISGVKVLAKEIEADSPKELRESADRLKDKLHSGIIVLGAKKGQKAMLTCVVTPDLVDRFKAGDLIKELSEVVGGEGGGRPDMAQGGGPNPDKLGEALDQAYKIVKEAAS